MGLGLATDVFQHKLCLRVAVWVVIIQSIGLTAEQVPVRHIEGVALGFLVLRNPDGEALAYGDWKQVVKTAPLLRTVPQHNHLRQDQVGTPWWQHLFWG